MKRIYADEKWCIGCHLCEYNCAYANAADSDRRTPDSFACLLKDRTLQPHIRIEEEGGISYAVSCRHCKDPLCFKSCISGAVSILEGTVMIDENKCVGCYTCVLVCPYGAVLPSREGKAVRKCQLCMKNSAASPACVAGCPNHAIVYEER